MQRRRVLGAVAGSLAGLTAGCLSRTPVVGSVSRTDRHQFDAVEDLSVSVEVERGGLAVKPADGDEVELEIEYEGPSEDAIDESSARIEETNGLLRIEIEPEETSVLFDDVSADVAVRLPEAATLVGAGVEGGGVEVRGIAADATISATGGSALVRDVDGVVSLSAENGAVDAAGIERLRRAEATNGAVEVEVPTITEDAEIRASNGAIDAALAPDLDAEVSATATNGTVDTADLSFNGESDGDLLGTLGDGSRRLTVRVTNGAIRLRELS